MKFKLIFSFVALFLSNEYSYAANKSRSLRNSDLNRKLDVDKNILDKMPPALAALLPEEILEAILLKGIINKFSGIASESDRPSFSFEGGTDQDLSAVSLAAGDAELLALETAAVDGLEEQEDERSIPNILNGAIITGVAATTAGTTAGTAADEEGGLLKQQDVLNGAIITGVAETTAGTEGGLLKQQDDSNIVDIFNTISAVGTAANEVGASTRNHRSLGAQGELRTDQDLSGASLAAGDAELLALTTAAVDALQHQLNQRRIVDISNRERRVGTSTHIDQDLDENDDNIEMDFPHEVPEGLPLWELDRNHAKRKFEEESEEAIRSIERGDADLDENDDNIEMDFPDENPEGLPLWELDRNHEKRKFEEESEEAIRSIERGDADLDENDDNIEMDFPHRIHEGILWELDRNHAKRKFEEESEEAIGEEESEEAIRSIEREDADLDENDDNIEWELDRYHS